MNGVGDFGIRLADTLASFSIALPDYAVSVCQRHFDVLSRWNRVMNLVGDFRPETAVLRHYGESLFLASLFSLEEGVVVDFGSGAGFPAVGIAALHPGVSMVLAEARSKRAAFLSEAFRGVAGVRVRVGDAALYGDPVAWVCARAVDPSVVVEFAIRQNAGLALLISVSDADALMLQEGLSEWSRSVHPLPWRPESVVFVAAK